MQKAFGSWMFGTAIFAVAVLSINYFLYGFPPEPYTSLFLGGGDVVSWLQLEDGLTRYVDLLFAPFVGVVYMFYNQRFFHESEHYGVLFFGCLSYVFMTVFHGHHYTYLFHVLVAVSVAVYVKHPASFKLIFSILVLTGWYTMGAQEKGLGLFPWSAYFIILVVPSVVAMVLRMGFRRLQELELE